MRFYFFCNLTGTGPRPLSTIFPYERLQKETGNNVYPRGTRLHTSERSTELFKHVRSTPHPAPWPLESYINPPNHAPSSLSSLNLPLGRSLFLAYSFFPHHTLSPHFSTSFSSHTKYSFFQKRSLSPLPHR